MSTPSIGVSTDKLPIATQLSFSLSKLSICRYKEVCDLFIEPAMGIRGDELSLDGYVFTYLEKTKTLTFLRVDKKDPGFVIATSEDGNSSQVFEFFGTDSHRSMYRCINSNYSEPIGLLDFSVEKDSIDHYEISESIFNASFLHYECIADAGQAPIDIDICITKNGYLLATAYTYSQQTVEITINTTSGKVFYVQLVFSLKTPVSRLSPKISQDGTAKASFGGSKPGSLSFACVSKIKFEDQGISYFKANDDEQMMYIYINNRYNQKTLESSFELAPRGSYTAERNESFVLCYLNDDGSCRYYMMSIGDSLSALTSPTRSTVKMAVGSPINIKVPCKMTFIDIRGYLGISPSARVAGFTVAGINREPSILDVSGESSSVYSITREGTLNFFNPLANFKTYKFNVLVKQNFAQTRSLVAVPNSSLDDIGLIEISCELRSELAVETPAVKEFYGLYGTESIVPLSTIFPSSYIATTLEPGQRNSSTVDILEIRKEDHLNFHSPPQEPVDSVMSFPYAFNTFIGGSKSEVYDCTFSFIKEKSLSLVKNGDRTEKIRRGENFIDCPGMANIVAGWTELSSTKERRGFSVPSSAAGSTLYIPDVGEIEIMSKTIRFSYDIMSTAEIPKLRLISRVVDETGRVEFKYTKLRFTVARTAEDDNFTLVTGTSNTFNVRDNDFESSENDTTIYMYNKASSDAIASSDKVGPSIAKYESESTIIKFNNGVVRVICKVPCVGNPFPGADLYTGNLADGGTLQKLTITYIDTILRNPEVRYVTAAPNERTSGNLNANESIPRGLTRRSSILIKRSNSVPMMITPSTENLFIESFLINGHMYNLSETVPETIAHFPGGIILLNRDGHYTLKARPIDSSESKSIVSFFKSLAGTDPEGSFPLPTIQCKMSDSTYRMVVLLWEDQANTRKIGPFFFHTSPQTGPVSSPVKSNLFGSIPAGPVTGNSSQDSDAGNSPGLEVLGYRFIGDTNFTKVGAELKNGDIVFSSCYNGEISYYGKREKIVQIQLSVKSGTDIFSTTAYFEICDTKKILERHSNSTGKLDLADDQKIVKYSINDTSAMAGTILNYGEDQFGNPEAMFCIDEKGNYNAYYTNLKKTYTIKIFFSDEETLEMEFKNVQAPAESKTSSRNARRQVSDATFGSGSSNASVGHKQRQNPNASMSHFSKLLHPSNIPTSRRFDRRGSAAISARGHSKSASLLDAPECVSIAESETADEQVPHVNFGHSDTTSSRVEQSVDEKALRRGSEQSTTFDLPNYVLPLSSNVRQGSSVAPSSVVDGSELETQSIASAKPVVPNVRSIPQSRLVRELDAASPVIGTGVSRSASVYNTAAPSPMLSVSIPPTPGAPKTPGNKKLFIKSGTLLMSDEKQALEAAGVPLVSVDPKYSDYYRTAAPTLSDNQFVFGTSMLKIPTGAALTCDLGAVYGFSAPNLIILSVSSDNNNIESKLETQKLVFTVKNYGSSNITVRYTILPQYAAKEFPDLVVSHYIETFTISAKKVSSVANPTYMTNDKFEYASANFYVQNSPKDVIVSAGIELCQCNFGIRELEFMYYGFNRTKNSSSLVARTSNTLGSLVLEEFFTIVRAKVHFGVATKCAPRLSDLDESYLAYTLGGDERCYEIVAGGGTLGCAELAAAASGAIASNSTLISAASSSSSMVPVAIAGTAVAASFISRTSDETSQQRSISNNITPKTSVVPSVSNSVARPATSITSTQTSIPSAARPSIQVANTNPQQSVARPLVPVATITNAQPPAPRPSVQIDSVTVAPPAPRPSVQINSPNSSAISNRPVTYVPPVPVVPNRMVTSTTSTRVTIPTVSTQSSNPIPPRTSLPQSRPVRQQNSRTQRFVRIVGILRRYIDSK